MGQLGTPDWAVAPGPGGRVILDLLLRHGAVSQAELSRRLELSQPSVARLVAKLTKAHVVGLSARPAAGPGNPSMMVALAPDYAYGLGIGVSGDAVSIAIVDLTGHARASAILPMRNLTRAYVLERVIALRGDMIAKAGIDETRIVGAGVGFAGFFAGAPLRFNPPALLTDWVDADIAATFAEALGMPVVCDNDATTAAIAESRLGVGRQCANFAYCHLTNGFGGAWIFDGRPVRGALGNAGDFGAVWWLLDDGYPNLELLRTLVATRGNAFETVEEMLLSICATTAGVEDWLKAAEQPFAKLCFLLGHIVAPEKVVIGGRLPHWLAVKLSARICMPTSPSRHARPFPLPEIVAREVEGDAVAIGAGLMPLQLLFFE